MPNIIIWIGAGALLLFVLFLLSFLAVWVRARLAGAEVGLFDLVGMRLRSVPYAVIVDAKIAATKAGLTVDVEKIDVLTLTFIFCMCYFRFFAILFF